VTLKLPKIKPTSKFGAGFLILKYFYRTTINIYPEEIEGELNNMDYVNESLVVEKGGRLTALINPDWAAIDEEKIPLQEVEKLMQANINELNKSLPAYSQVTGLKLYQEEFDKTPKRSIKRYLYQ